MSDDQNNAITYASIKDAARVLGGQIEHVKSIIGIKDNHEDRADPFVSNYGSDLDVCFGSFEYIRASVVEVLRVLERPHTLDDLAKMEELKRLSSTKGKERLAAFRRAVENVGELYINKELMGVMSAMEGPFDTLCRVGDMPFPALSMDS